MREVLSNKFPLRLQIYHSRRFTACRGWWPMRCRDRFGNVLLDAWLATEGRTPESFNAVERLCYTGVRGMGALEFRGCLG